MIWWCEGYTGAIMSHAILLYWNYIEWNNPSFMIMFDYSYPIFLIIIMGFSIMIWFDYDWMIVSMILYYRYPMDSYPMWASQFLVSKPPIVTTKTRQRHRNREPSWPTKAYEFTWNPSIKLQKFYTAQVGKGSLLQLGEAPRAMLWPPLRRGWPFWPDSCRLENHHFFHRLINTLVNHMVNIILLVVVNLAMENHYVS